MSLTVRDGALVVQDPGDVSVYEWNWSVLATGVTITTSSFSVVAVRPSSATIPTITDSGSGLGIQVGGRSTKVKVSGGVTGATYELRNTIVTSETPAQTKRREVRLLIQS
jgi:hypothetical protein